MKILFIVSFLLFAGVAQAQELKLVWTDNSDNELGFQVERGPAESGPFSWLKATAVNVATYTDSTVTPGVTYCYRVRAFNTKVVDGATVKQFSDYSNVACGSWSAAPPPPSAPLAPTDLLISKPE